MRKLELIHNNNTQTLVTITPDRVTIKFKADQIPQYEGRIEAFILQVVEGLIDQEFSLRGTIQGGYLCPFWITMKNNSGEGQTFKEVLTLGTHCAIKDQQPER